METEYYSDDEEFQEPPPRTFKTVLNQAGGVVTGAAKSVAEQTENAGDYLRRKISKMDKWAESSRVSVRGLLYYGKDSILKNDKLGRSPV